MRITIRTRRRLVTSLRILLTIGCAVVSGCSFFETQLQRTARPDGRFTLGWQERVQVPSRDIAKYKCENGYFLRCDGAGAATLSCTCSLR